MVAFSFLLDACHINSSTILAMNESRHETEKNQKKRKIATCEGAQRPNLLGVGSGGGFTLPQKILQF